MDFFDSVFADQDRQRREQLVKGISIAKVTGRMADGTYELQFLGMGGNAPSAPARMMMPGAGARRGMHMMPEVGDEVVVAFESGDSNSPVILGGLFNNDSPAPDQAQPSNENNVRTIVSRSGHEITLDDTPGAGKIVVKTKDGRGLTLDDTLPGKVSLETAGGISITLDDASGTLTLSAPIAIVLQALNVQITAPAGIALTTTGATIPSTLLIENKPYFLHTHGIPNPVTPTVTP